MKKLLALAVVTLTLLTGCTSHVSSTVKLSLAPVPYSMRVDSKIAPFLSVATATGDFAKQAAAAGAQAQAIVYYTPRSGSRAIFMAVYYFPAATFDALKNPNEPPAYGQEVIRKNGMVFSIAGPQDSIFDPNTQDGKNISILYATITKPETYSPLL